jgi:hypothetical protein
MEMAKAVDTVTFKVVEASGLVFEFQDVPMDRIGQVRAQFGQNGQLKVDANRGDYEGFRKSLSEKARKFLGILRDNPAGITADHLVEKMGFKTGTQIGGLTGGGIKKNANKFNLPLSDVYVTEVKFEDGQRIVTYKPGKEIAKFQ